ncbi:MAG: hypothetical protein ACYCO5_15670 [Acidobacteriaceae bacterium]
MSKWQAEANEAYQAAGVAVLVVGHTVRGQGEDEIVRNITARKATRKEREQYAENC